LYLKAEALKSFLNNLSSKYTQEFSLAVIRLKTLKQSIIVKVFVRLCVIQFTRYRGCRTPGCPFIAQLNYSITKKTYCQELFSNFFKFFFSVPDRPLFSR